MIDNNIILKKFTEKYIDFVRDTTLSQVYRIIEGKSKASAYQQLYHKISQIPIEYQSTLHELVTISVDKCLHYTLFMLEEYEE